MRPTDRPGHAKARADLATRNNDKRASIHQGIIKGRKIKITSLAYPRRLGFLR